MSSLDRRELHEERDDDIGQCIINDGRANAFAVVVTTKDTDTKHQSIASSTMEHLLSFLLLRDRSRAKNLRVKSSVKEFHPF